MVLLNIMIKRLKWGIYLSYTNNLLNDELIEFIDSVPVLSSEQSYWLVRSNSGKYFYDFLDNSFIGVDSFNIPLSEFQNNKSLITPTVVSYKELISNYYDTNNTELNKIARRLINFIAEMKENDIILTPSKNSQKYLIGFVGKLFDFTPDFTSAKPVGKTDINICKYNIRRSVTWVKEVPASEFDLKFHDLKYSHHTILKVNRYSELIDPLIFPYYIKEDAFYVNYSIKSKHNISVSTWTKYQVSLQNILGDEIANNSYLKQRVQSPGDAMLIIDKLSSLIPYIAAIIGGLGLSSSEIKTKNISLKGILPFLFNGIALHKQIKLENESIVLENQLRTLEIEKLKKELAQPSLPEQVPEMSMSLKDAGRMVLPLAQTQTDSCDLKDEGLSLVQEKPKVEQQ